MDILKLECKTLREITNMFLFGFRAIPNDIKECNSWNSTQSNSQRFSGNQGLHSDYQYGNNEILIELSLIKEIKDPYLKCAGSQMWLSGSRGNF